MARPTPILSPDDVRDQLRDSLLLLRSVRGTLRDLLERAMDEGAGLREVSSKQAELETALRRAFETEAKWSEFEGRTGAGAGPEVDYAALRVELSCRLARVATCCAEG